MDITSGLKSEVFRPVVTLLVPGATALAPFVLVVQEKMPATEQFWKDHPSAFVAIIVASTIAAGLILEDLGARIEGGLWDRLLKRRYSDHGDIWNAYLGLKLKDEIVGQRYLNTMLVRMKFELSMAIALILHGIGLWWLNQMLMFWQPRSCELLLVCLAAITVFLLRESYDSAEVLSNTRRILVSACARLETRPPALPSPHVVTGTLYVQPAAVPPAAPAAAK